jgi:hypothetical protein
MRKWILVTAVLLTAIAALVGWRILQDAENRERFVGLSLLLEAELAAYESKRWPIAPAFGEPVEGALLEHLRYACELSGVDLALPGPWAVDDLPSDRPLPAGVLTWLTARRAAIGELLLAARAVEVGTWPDIRWGWSESPPRDARNPIPAFLGAKEMLRLDAIRCAQAGKGSEAADRILAVAQLGRAARCCGPIIRNLVALVCTEEAAGTTAILAGCGQLDRGSRHRLRSWAIRALSANRDWAGILKFEALSNQGLIAGSASGNTDSLYDMSGRFRLPYTKRPWYERITASDATPILDLWEACREATARTVRAAERGPAAAVEEWRKISAETEGHRVPARADCGKGDPAPSPPPLPDPRSRPPRVPRDPRPLARFRRRVGPPRRRGPKVGLRDRSRRRKTAHRSRPETR